MASGRREDEFAETQQASGDETPPLASDETKPLAPGTVVADRYMIGSLLGRGGMGTVYMAHDTSLGRQVALKLHRRTSEAERLYREALAMAQLDHPNVVTVFEVGTHAEQRFVAMEYVRGQTLRAWAAGKPWRAVAEMLIEAGEGLYAAHRKGLVHRDFKPENVLVDEDGRPRVSDFGLARAVGDTSVVSVPSGPLPTISGTGPMTIEGAIIGTPAYMAPEQFAGEPVDARSDQFAFCIAAWELLFRRRPFEGATFEELKAAISSGALQMPPETDVPRAVQRVLRRGLARRPAERWPTMDVLLGALRSAIRPRRSRLWWLAAVPVVAAGVIAVALLLRSHASCASAGDEIEALFPPALRDRVAKAADARAAKNVAAFVGDYRASAKHACEAGARHDWSAELVARSRSCRREQLRRLTTVIGEIFTDKLATSRMAAATTAFGEWAELAPCTDPTVLATMPALTDDLADARGDLLAAFDIAALTGFGNAKQLVDLIERGPLGKTAELQAPLLLAHANLTHDADLDKAIKLASDGYYRAHSEGDGVSELLALRHLLYWIGDEKSDATAVEPWYRLALSEVDRLERQSKTRAAQLRGAIVGVAMTRNELPVALEQAKRAVDEVPPEMPLMRATALRDYAGALSESGDDAKAVPIYDECVKLLIATIGDDDIQVAQTMADFALTLSSAGQIDRAADVARKAAAMLKKHPNVTGEDRAVPELNFGVVLTGAHANLEARALLNDARETLANQPPTPLLASIENALALLDVQDGHPEQAETLERHALSIDEAALGKDHTDVASILCILALAQRDRHDAAGALASAKRCSQIRDAATPGSQGRAEALSLVAELENDAGDHEAALRDAGAALALPVPHASSDSYVAPRIEQARALIELQRDPERAKQLLAEARTHLEAAHQATSEVDALAAKLR
ncbi:MAG TPA: serine/threonine-protein kinase [Kofleriaceae bacterium]|nr:serine/threonine-protein kinase [Kofleriaceae bacterium]